MGNERAKTSILQCLLALLSTGHPLRVGHKIHPRGLVYKWDGDNNSRSSPEIAEFIYYQDRKILLEII